MDAVSPLLPLTSSNRLCNEQPSKCLAGPEGDGLTTGHAPTSSGVDADNDVAMDDNTVENSPPKESSMEDKPPVNWRLFMLNLPSRDQRRRRSVSKGDSGAPDSPQVCLNEKARGAFGRMTEASSNRKVLGRDCSWLHATGCSPVTLNECIESFTTLEKLGEDNIWYCSVCKKHQMATKKIDLWKLPTILVFHLKRFFQSDRYIRFKCDYRVTFPYRVGETLDMSNYVLPQARHVPDFSPKYECFAASKHVGSLAGGHYTAQVKCRVKDADGNVSSRWHHFNDRFVHPDDDSPVDTNEAYLLFYEVKRSSTERTVD